MSSDLILLMMNLTLRRVFREKMPATGRRRRDRHPQEVKSVSEKMYPWGTGKEVGDEEKARGGKECAETGDREDNKDQTERGKKHTRAKKIWSLLLEPHSTDQPQNEWRSREQGKACSVRLGAEVGEQVHFALKEKRD